MPTSVYPSGMTVCNPKKCWRRRRAAMIWNLSPKASRISFVEASDEKVGAGVLIGVLADAQEKYDNIRSM